MIEMPPYSLPFHRSSKCHGTCVNMRPVHFAQFSYFVHRVSATPTKLIETCNIEDGFLRSITSYIIKADGNPRKPMCK